jgi:hypothetical protein
MEQKYQHFSLKTGYLAERVWNFLSTSLSLPQNRFFQRQCIKSACPLGHIFHLRPFAISIFTMHFDRDIERLTRLDNAWARATFKHPKRTKP